MPLIEGFKIKNYRSLKNIELGKLMTNNQDSLSSLITIIGKNGTGKSTLFDAFGFLADALKFGVEEACDLKHRGGFDKIVSAGSQEGISFEIYYRENKKESPITYELSINKKNGRVIVEKESLKQRKKESNKFGHPYCYLKLSNGKGYAWNGNPKSDKEKDRINISLADKNQLGIASYGALKEHPRIVKFRKFIENWYLSYFTPDAARSLPNAGPQKHLNIHGDNIGNVVQYLERDHPDAFKNILKAIAKKIPGIDKIDTKKTDDSRLLLRFNDNGFKDPFYAQQMSDGTLKLFAYLLLLEDPEPPPFICIEEPENGLYHKLLETLVDEFRKHTEKNKKNSSQIFITTHQPYLVNALKPEETWILEKGKDGFSSISRASDNKLIVSLVNEGIPLGGLWYSNYFDKE